MNETMTQKYQPLILENFEMDEDLRNLITSLINTNMLNMLFVGDSGSGKTSIINATINKYYGQGTNFKENVLYINSLKDQGINFYRNDVKLFCQTSSIIPNKKKIIVLDDVDIINVQSQQVFRNCMDKYSKNVHFIASCVNTQKVIDSLQSRMTLIKIKPLKPEYLKKILYNIKKTENMIIDDDAEKFLLFISDSSARVLINYLEKLKLLDEPIDFNLVNNICTNISFNDFDLFTEYCKTGQLKKSISILYDIFNKGYSVMDILDSYFLFIKTTKLDDMYKYEIIKLLCKYITIFNDIHEDEIELSLFVNNMVELFSNKNI